jgi:hypothetical protein
MLVVWTQACRRWLRYVSGRCSFTLPRHCPSWKIKECPRRVGVRSSWLSPRSRLSKLGGPCSNREGPQESCDERAAPPPNLCYPPRRRRHCLPDHAQRRITLRSPGIPAIGHRRSAQVAVAAARPRTTFTMSTSVGVNVRSPHRLAPARPPPRCTQPRGAPTPQRRC